MNCVSIIVDVEGDEQELCLTHVSGNETFVKDFNNGNRRAPLIAEVKRALVTNHKVKAPTVVLMDEMDICPL